METNQYPQFNLGGGGTTPGQSGADASPLDEESLLSSLLDFRQAIDLIEYLLLALKRRWVMLALIAFCVSSIITGIVLLLPKTYEAKTTIMARPNEMIRILVNPEMRNGDTDPKQGVQAFVLTRDNLRRVVRDVDLLNHWKTHRSAVQQFKDDLMLGLLGPPNDADIEEGLLDTVSKKVSIGVDQDTLTFAAQWSDPEMVVKITESLKQIYLDVRRHQEIDVLVDALSILESQKAELQNNVDQTLAELREQLEKERLVKEAKAEAKEQEDRDERARDRAERIAVLRMEFQRTQTLERLKSNLDVKRRTVSEQESEQKKKVATLQDKLDSLQQTFAPTNPEVVAVRNKLEEALKENESLDDLKKEEKTLEEQYFSALGDGPTNVLDPSSGRSTNLVDAIELSLKGADQKDVEQTNILLTRLRGDVTNLESVKRRAFTVQMETEAAKVAFGYRYAVIIPPEYPKKPIKPVVPLLIGVGVFVGVFLGAIAAVGAEILSGKVIQSWQIERFLGVRVLEEI